MNKRILTFEEWAEIGSEFKKIDAMLTKLQCGNIQHVMNKHELEPLRVSCNNLGKVRTEAESRMFQQISKCYVNTRGLLDVFYDNNPEPAKEPARKVP